jgi:hypothetical protein
MLFAPISPIQRLLHPSYGDQVSADAHRILRATGLDIIRQHPFFGIGLGNFKATTAELRVLASSSAMAHNTYLEYAAELGIPALLIFLGVLISTFFLLENVRKGTSEPFFRQVALGLQAGLIGFAGSAFFLSAEYVKPFWLVVFISCCMPPLILAKRVPGKAPQEVKESPSEARLGFGTVRKAGGLLPIPNSRGK